MFLSLIDVSFSLSLSLPFFPLPTSEMIFLRTIRKHGEINLRRTLTSPYRHIFSLKLTPEVRNISSNFNKKVRFRHIKPEK